MAHLDATKVDETLVGMTGWHRRGHELIKIFTTPTHTEAARLAAAAAGELEKCSHEPSVGIRLDGNRVYIDMHTPDEGGITEADFELADRIDRAARGSIVYR